jgi:hypothetical protein
MLPCWCGIYENFRRLREIKKGTHARRFVRSDAGREPEHDEAVAADGERLLREPERVAAASVDDAVGAQRRGRPRDGAPQHGPGAAQRRGAQRRHVHLAAGALRPGVRLHLRREHALSGPPCRSFHIGYSCAVRVP